MKENGLFTTEGVTLSNRCLHTPNCFAKQNLLYVQEVGQLKSLTPHKNERSGLDSFLFLCVTAGTGTLEVDGKQYEIKKGDCALLNCMQPYSHISSAQDHWELAWVHFNGTIAKAYFDFFYQSNQDENVVFGTETRQWQSIVTSLLETQKSKSIMAELESGELLLHLLNCLVGAAIKSNTLTEDTDGTWYKEIRELINERYADPSLMDDLTSRFGLSVELLDRRFQKQFGIGLQEYIDNRRLNAAKELLRFSIIPVEDVAQKSGLGDTDIMQQIFLENENMSAQEYRSKWAQWIK
ncbi:MAG: AraC family transcriptional regulator [Lachnospiraceae bacterium]|nr:AraC family transcriptional regulator [Lachnospiraceae bacterium]